MIKQFHKKSCFAAESGGGGKKKGKGSSFQTISATHKVLIVIQQISITFHEHQVYNFDLWYTNSYYQTVAPEISEFLLVHIGIPSVLKVRFVFMVIGTTGKAHSQP